MRKGQAFMDYAIYGIFILFAVIILIIVGMLMVTFNSVFADNPDLKDVRDGALEGVTGFDIAVVILVIGMAVVIFMLSYMFNNSPVFFGIFLMLTFIMLLISIPMVNGVYDFISQTSLAPTMARMPATNFIINNWVWVIVTYVGVSIVGFGAKSKAEDIGGASL